MAAHADGSIIVDTQLDSEGFKAGSSELLEAIKSLSKEMRTLGETLKSTFSGSGVGKATQEADANITELQNRIKELEATLADMKDQQIAPTVDPKTEARIKELENTVSQLRAQLQETSAQPMVAEVDISEAESKITALETKVQELEQVIASLQSGEQSTGANVNFGGTTGSASALQRQIEAVNNSVNNLEPTFQRAMGGSESAMTSFQGRAAQLESKIATLKAKLAELGNTRMPTAEFVALSKEEERAGVKLESLLNKQERMKAMGVKENSAQWKNLVYDLQLASQKYDQLAAAKARMEASGTAYTMGADTQQYAVMSNTLSTAQAKLAQMRAESTATASVMSRIAGGARSLLSHLSGAARTIGGGILSGLRSALASTKKLISSNKAYKNSFSGVLSKIKQIGPALLMARGVMGILRKAVTAYMQANQELANTLSSCWTSIGNLLGPIITRLVNLVASAIAYFTAFLRLLGFTGKAASSAIGGAGGAAEEETDKLKKSLASFDELNILSDSSSDSGGGGGGNTAEALPDAELPDWAALMAQQLKEGNWAAAAQTLTDQLNKMVVEVNWEEVGNTAGYYLNGALTFLATAITTFDWYSLGSGLATSINQIIETVDWSNLGIVLGAKFIALLGTLAGFVDTLDWSGVGTAFSDGFMGLWNSIDFSRAGITLSNGVKGVLNSISTAIQNTDWRKMGNDVASFIAAIDWSGVTTALFNGIGSAVGGLAAFLWGLIEDAWASVVDWWYDVAYEDGEFTMEGLLQGIWNGICNIGSWIKTNIFDPFINGFKAAFGINSPSTVMAEQGDYIVQGLLQGISNAWSSIVSFFKNALSSITSTLSSAWSSIKTATSKAWNEVSSTISSAWSSIKSTASSAVSKLKTTASNAWSSIKSTASSGWTGIKTSISSAWTSIKSTASSATSSIKTTASNAWSNIKSTLSSAWSSIKSTDSSSWASLKSTASSAASSIKSTCSSAWSSIKSTASSSWSSVKSTLSSTWSSIKSTASSSASSIKSTLSSAWSSVKSTTSSTWSSIKSTLSSSWSSIKSTASSTWSSIKSTIQNQGWSGVGSGITSGIKTGISNGWYTLTNWVKQKAQSLLSAAKSALGIHSPSRLFRDQVGLNIGLGIGEGIEGSESSVLDSVVGVADAIAEEFNAGEYEAANIIPTTEVNGALTSFANTITNSFTDLLNKLQAIAESVTFQVPVAANRMMPYKASAAAGEGGADFNSVMEASNDELIAALTQLFGVATETIVAAIKQYSGTTVNFDENTLTTAIIKEINRRTRMTGQSPLVG